MAHVFFSIAIILSIVAMATHQVRSGLALLAGSLASIGVCAILFICGVAVIAAAALHAAPKSRPELTSMTQPAPTTRLATPVVSGRGPVAAPSYTAPTATYTWEADPNATKPVAAPSYTAPTATVTYTPPAPTATPIDHAARDRQIGALQKRIDQLDETVRRVRADPHWYGIVPRSTDTARQQSSDAYLDQLDKQRNDLRRQKWALEGR